MPGMKIKDGERRGNRKWYLLICSMMIMLMLSMMSAGAETADIPGSSKKQVVCAGAAAGGFITGEKYGTTYEPALCIDGDETTSWQFSLDDSQLGSIYSEFYFSSSVTINELWIKNGFWRFTKGLDQYIRNGRIKTFEVSVKQAGSEGYQYVGTYTLEDDAARLDWQKIQLGTLENVRTVRLLYQDVYIGTHFTRDIAVSEIMFVQSAASEATGSFVLNPLTGEFEMVIEEASQAEDHTENGAERHGMALGSVAVFREAKNSKKIATLKAGQMAVILGAEGKYYRVRVGEKEGYINSDDLRCLPNELLDTGYLAKKGSRNGSGSVAVYNKTDTGSKVVAKWPVGKNVEIYQYTDSGWVLIHAGDYYGYVKDSSIVFE